MVYDHPRVSAAPPTVRYLVAFANVIRWFDELATVAAVPQVFCHEIEIRRAT
jgi:hypothetical protein